MRPTELERSLTDAGAGAGEGTRRVGVDALEAERTTNELEFEFELLEEWGRVVDGVEDLEFVKGRVLSPGELAVVRVLAGVDERDWAELVAGDGLAVDREVERLLGVVGLEDTEAELVLRAVVLLLLDK